MRILFGVWCVCVAATFALAAEGQAERAGGAVLALTVEEPASDPGPNGESALRGPLLREVVRQAVLIAGRDGLGLATRDQCLREPFPADTAPLKPHMHAVHTIGITFTLEREVNGKPVTSQTFLPIKEADHVILVNQLAQMEELSRTKLIETLESMGYEAAPRPAEAEAPSIDGVEDQINSLALFPQFDAVRRLHATIRARGESEELLGQLVRAYANLGQQTQCIWGAAHKAYRARSLLYAQRMVATHPESANAVYHRAYAWALCGIHALAAEDLARAETMAKAAGTAPPPWAPLLVALCEFDTAELRRAAAEGPQAPLAALLAFITVEGSHAISHQMEVGFAALEISRDSFRVLDALHGVAGVGYLHSLTMAAPERLAESLGDRLPKMDRLPQAVRDVLASEDTRKALTRARVGQALVGSVDTDDGEPSWAAVGIAIEDLNVVQINRRAYFMAYQWAVGADELVETVRPAVRPHPYNKLILSYDSPMLADQAAFANLVRDLSFTDAGPELLPFYWHFQRHEPKEQRRTAHALWARAWKNGEVIYSDTLHILDYYRQYPNDAKALGYAAWLESISPRSPRKAAIRVRLDWPNQAKKAAALEEEFRQHPDVLGALAQQYARAQQWADAERCLKASMTISADPVTAQDLADVYLAQGREDLWLATLEGALRQEDYGLLHARVNQKIAEHYMNTDRFAEAKPYALASARSGAGWALVTAARCYEGLEEWEFAERYMRALSERYDNSRDDWYQWCLATGRGDLQAARQFLLDWLAGFRGAETEDTWSNLALIAAADGDSAKSLEYGRNAFESNRDPGQAIRAALAADELGDTAARDRLLQQAVERGLEFKLLEYRDRGGVRAEVLQLAQMMRDSLAKGDRAGLEPEAIEKLLSTTTNNEDVNVLYLAGCFLLKHGDEEQGWTLLRRCVEKEHARHKTNWMLARLAVERRDAKPEAPRERRAPAAPR